MYGRSSYRLYISFTRPDPIYVPHVISLTLAHSLFPLPPAQVEQVKAEKAQSAAAAAAGGAVTGSRGGAGGGGDDDGDAGLGAPR